MSRTIPPQKPFVTADIGTEIGTPGAAMPVLTDVHDAIYHIAHDYPGGIPALAVRMKMNPHTLQKKVSPTCDTHHVTVAEFIAIQAFADRFDPLYSAAAALDHEPPLRKSNSPASESETEVDVAAVHLQLAHIGAESGDVYRQVHAALQKRSISPNDRSQIRKEVSEAIAALNGLLEVL
ncbi:phage regulatory CII family protein [Caldimonas tepidiphila]|uniref:phage regulatory CII family protein n=1 Tax=Caldimonas tepidiphila TaxID=2315841 RepID=UPI001300BE45|nr:phage regulatory CII family protein [Caldimonas tepidiphila]